MDAEAAWLRGERERAGKRRAHACATKRLWSRPASRTAAAKDGTLETGAALHPRGGWRTQLAHTARLPLRRTHREISRRSDAGVDLRVVRLRLGDDGAHGLHDLLGVRVGV